MDYPKCDLAFSKETDTFEFLSVGPNGHIPKLVKFQETDTPLLYNLAFGDKVLVVKNGRLETEIDDKIVSENGDRNIVLATVVAAIYAYTTKHPERWLLIVGSNLARTRLYRMAITKNFDELNKDFHIFGLEITNNVEEIVPFSFNGNFTGFIARRK